MGVGDNTEFGKCDVKGTNWLVIVVSLLGVLYSANWE